MRKAIWPLAILLLMLGLPMVNSGCFWLLAGGAAGYGVSPDSVQASFDTSASHAYHQSLVVMRKLGKTTMEDEKGGWVKADFDNYNVAVHIEQKTANSVQVTVSARKYATPRPQKARDVLDMISARLR
ncbi:MAG: hypothetical protein PHU91_02955 [Candidatus Omnitrophica bacterium]|nr:hypothetical protein [Candidatus Omnitrophota bacterium]MDD5236600.1 hypothetical protein [Candidatus Omnitrophota bacterium]MDD5610443.1 hypothetical protein [Candidatus Omnitrophota bacterium]